MPVSKNIKQLFATKHKPDEPVIRAEKVSSEMAEAFLFNADEFDAYAALNSDSSFIIEPKWVVNCGEDGISYVLYLTLLINTGRGQPIKVGIPEGSGIWNAIVTASEINDVVIRIPYPPPV